MFVRPTLGVGVRVASPVAPTSESDWLDFGATASARGFDDVVVVVPSLDDSGKRVAATLSDLWDIIDNLTGPNVLVLLPVIVPRGQSIRSLEWSSNLGGAAVDHTFSQERRTRESRPGRLIADIRDDIKAKGFAVPEQTFALYLDFEVSPDDPQNVDVYGESVQLGTEPDEALLQGLARAWGEAAKGLARPRSRGAFASATHGGSFPSAISWRVVASDAKRTVDLVAGWFKILHSMAK